MRESFGREHRKKGVKLVGKVLNLGLEKVGKWLSMVEECDLFKGDIGASIIWSTPIDINK